MKIKPSGADSEEISRIRQQLHVLGEQYLALLHKLIGVDEMVIGSCFEVYKTCGKPNCRCQRGEKHGPFLALTFSVAGKVHHKMVRQADQVIVRQRSQSYRDFQSTRRELRIVSRSIDELLDKIRASQAREYS